MRAFLVGASICSSDLSTLLRAFKISSGDLLVGVDGGTLTWLECGYLPTFAVGDWDSLKGSRQILENIPHLSLSTAKDRSDLHYAGRTVLAMGVTELICFGVTGGRADHHLASLFDLSEFSTGIYGKLTQVRALDGESQFFFLAAGFPTSARLARWSGEFKKGTLVSVFSMEGQATGVTLKGFSYPLKNSKISASSRGLSNTVRIRKCEVRLRKGRLLVIMPCNESKSGLRK